MQESEFRFRRCLLETAERWIGGEHTATVVVVTGARRNRLY